MKIATTDIETWGLGPKAVVRTIALVTPDSAYHWDIRHTIDAQLNALRVITPSTVVWWAEQEVDPFENTKIEVISEIHAKFKEILADEDATLWSRGRFDVEILESLFADLTGYKTPWKYWQERDVRTLDYKFPPKKRAGKHNALIDCQINLEQIEAYLACTP